MAKELATTDDFGINISDMMMMVMMIAMMSLLSSPAITQGLGVQAQSYQGLTDNRDLDVTPTTQWINLISSSPYIGWVSASFFNDGPNSAFIGVNNPDGLVELKAFEPYSVSMLGAQRRIEFIFYRANLGERASVRAVGKW